MADYRALYEQKRTTCEEIAKQVQSGWSLALTQAPPTPPQLWMPLQKKSHKPIPMAWISTCCWIPIPTPSCRPMH